MNTFSIQSFMIAMIIIISGDCTGNLPGVQLINLLLQKDINYVGDCIISFVLWQTIYVPDDFKHCKDTQQGHFRTLTVDIRTSNRDLILGRRCTQH